MKDWLLENIYKIKVTLKDPDQEEEEQEEEEVKKKKKPLVRKPKVKKEETITMTKAQLAELIAEFKTHQDEEEEQEEEEQEEPKKKKSSADDSVLKILKNELTKTQKMMKKMEEDAEERRQKDEMLAYVKKLSKEKPYLVKNLDEIVENGASTIEEIEKIVEVVDEYAKNEWIREQEALKNSEKVKKATKYVTDSETKEQEGKEDIDKFKNFKELSAEEKEAILSEKFAQEALELFK